MAYHYQFLIETPHPNLSQAINGNHHYLKIEIILKAIKKIPIDIQKAIKIDFAILFCANEYQPPILRGDKGPNFFSSLTFLICQFVQIGSLIQQLRISNQGILGQYYHPLVIRPSSDI